MTPRRLALALAVTAACTASRRAPTPGSDGAPLANLDAAPIAVDAAAAPIEAPGASVVTAPRTNPKCELDWDALAEVAPATIVLQPIPAAGATLPDDCPPDFDPADQLAHGCTDCAVGMLAPSRPATLQLQGPDGSGHFATLGLTVGGSRPGYACVMASTVGWRHLYQVGELLAPLPWLADAGDGDPGVELITWQRLPWGNAEVTNAMVPIVYELAGDVLRRRDDRGAALAHRVAAAYTKLTTIRATRADHACYRVVADALDHWGR